MSSLFCRLISLLICLCATQQLVMAKVQLPSMFSDGMVIQRERSNLIWGKASPHESVSIKIGQQTKSVQADGNGNWSVKLDPLSVTVGEKLVIQGTNRLVVSNVQVGDVYLCSGQSNMALPLGASDFTPDDLSNLSKLQLKIYTAPNPNYKAGSPDPHGSWKTIDSDSVKSFPAIPYLFGRFISTKQQIPIGIISVPCCGASIESFLPPETVKRIHCEHTEFLAPGVIGSNFRVLLQPFLPYGMKGIVWYQGESNFLNTSRYSKIFPAFISDLRARMNSPQLPFYFVQLPNYGYMLREENQIVDSYWADLREAQAAALLLPNVFMVVSIDTANEPPLHPKEKRVIAQRLAQLVTNEKMSARKPPVIKDIVVKSDVMVLSFEGIDGKLHTSDGRPARGFQLAGADKKFYWAATELSGRTIKVSSDEVLEPKAVRYAWADNPDCNVCYDGMPLPPFRTDKWPTNPKLNPAAMEGLTDSSGQLARKEPGDNR